MTDKTSQQIASRIKQIRHRKSLTQVEVAKKAGISTNYYARLERGEVKPSVETLEKITRALKVKSSDVLPF
jgi:transcriptional regulator with XRE-family HTH domain